MNISLLLTGWLTVDCLWYVPNVPIVGVFAAKDIVKRLVVLDLVCARHANIVFRWLAIVGDFIKHTAD